MALTQKQIHDLSNMNVASQKVGLGSIIDDLINNGGGGTGKKMFIQYPRRSDFPIVGDADVLYADMNSDELYRWDLNVRQYEIIGTDYHKILDSIMSKSVFSTNTKSNQGYVDKAILSDTATNATNATNATKATEALQANKLTTPRTLSITGDSTGTSTSFDGSGDFNITLVLSGSGVVAGTYAKVTVDSKGRVIVGDNLMAADIPELTLEKS
jgi:hypothetical protein